MTRRWLDLVRGHLFTVAAVGSAYAIGYVSAIRYQNQFAPDTRYYAGMALWFSGDSQASAAQEVAARSAEAGFPSPPADQLFGWGLTQPRVVYPGLSAPFVKLFGIDGLAIVSGAAMALLVLLLAVVLSRRWGTVAAIGTLLLLCASHYLMFYGAAMLTESLTALWTTILAIVAWRYVRSPSAAGAISLAVVTIVLGFTRQATLIPAGAFVVAWLGAALTPGPNRWRVPALVVGGTAVGVQLLQLRLFTGFSQVDQFEKQTGTDSLRDALMKSPRLAWDILEKDFWRYARWDLPLFALLVLALISMVVFWRRTESHLLLGALIAYEIYNVTNGVPTAFRYGMPALVFVTSSAAMLLAEAGRRRDLDKAGGQQGEHVAAASPA